MMPNLAHTVLRNSALTFAAQLAIKLISFTFTIAVVRTLGAGDYGQYTAAMAFGSLFLVLGDLGLGPYTVREVARLRDEPDGRERIQVLYTNVLTVRLILTLISCALTLGAAWLTGRPLVMIGAIALNALAVLAYAVHGTIDAVLQGYERLDLASGARVLNQVVYVALGAAVLFFGLGYYGLIGATLVGVLVMTWTCRRALARLGITTGRLLAQSWPALLRAAIPFGIIGLTLGLSYRFDTVLLNIFRGDSETGFYNAAYNLVFSTAIISNVINTALYPSLTRQTMSDPGSLAGTVARVLRYMLLAGLPIAVGGSLLAPEITSFLYGDQYAPAAQALQIVIWVVPLMYISELLGYVVLISGREGLAARSVLISSSVNVAANLWLIPRYGMLAAAGITVVTELVLVGQYLWVLRRQLPIGQLAAGLPRPLLAVVLMGRLALVLQHIPLLVNILIAALVYSALLLLLRVVGRDELRFVRQLRAGTAGQVNS